MGTPLEDGSTLNRLRSMASQCNLQGPDSGFHCPPSSHSTPRPHHMSWRHRDNRPPRRLDGYFPPLPPCLQQNGSTRCYSQPIGYAADPAASLPAQGDSSPLNPEESSNSSSSTPALSSTAKYRPLMKADRDLCLQLDIEVSNTQAGHPPPPDPIAFFTTTDQPVCNSTLKDMLLSLIASLQSDVLHCMQEIHTIH